MKKTHMNKLFHKLADEGKAITMYRTYNNAYYVPAAIIQAIIKIRILIYNH